LDLKVSNAMYVVLSSTGSEFHSVGPDLALIMLIRYGLRHILSQNRSDVTHCPDVQDFVMCGRNLSLLSRVTRSVLNI